MIKKTLSAVVFSVLFTTISFAANKPTILAASKYKTVTHKVHSSNCEAKRKAIMNRCKYKHRNSISFCRKQDAKNARVCANLRKKVNAYKTRQKKKALSTKAADKRFNACIRTSGCDHKTDESATKWCYEHCHKRAGYSH